MVQDNFIEYDEYNMFECWFFFIIIIIKICTFEYLNVHGTNGSKADCVEIHIAGKVVSLTPNTHKMSIGYISVKLRWLYTW